jgi:AraC-like DNA-binding protein
VFAAHRVALLIGGSFHYESDFGATLLGPGSMLLGRAGGGYCYRHVDDGGDRSVTFDFSEEFLDHVRRSTGIRRTDRADFHAVSSIPASRHTTAATALTVQALYLDDPDTWEELALLVATTAVVGAVRIDAATDRLFDKTTRDLSWVEERKIARALRRVEAHHHEDCSLHVLADEAGMSIYRFLRLFKKFTSQTPRQYLVATRLRAAAALLIETTDKVLEIAYGVGFGDISHFNQAFAATFGVSPTRFRRQRGHALRKVASSDIQSRAWRRST